MNTSATWKAIKKQKVEVSHADTSSARGPIGMKILKVPYRLQGSDPICGLVALEAVMAYHGEPTTPTSDELFRKAKDAGYFAKSVELVGVEGGMFIAEDLGKLAADFGYRFKVLKAAGISILALLTANKPVLVPFVVGLDGYPTGTRPRRRPTSSDPLLASVLEAAPLREPPEPAGDHWGVIVGYYGDVEGTVWVVLQHGWKKQQYVVQLDRLLRSNAKTYEGLAGKIVEVWP